MRSWLSTDEVKRSDIDLTRMRQSLNEGEERFVLYPAIGVPQAMKVPAKLPLESEVAYLLDRH